jgi:hypothetical protein
VKLAENFPSERTVAICLETRLLVASRMTISTRAPGADGLSRPSMRILAFRRRARDLVESVSVDGSAASPPVEVDFISFEPISAYATPPGAATIGVKPPPMKTCDTSCGRQLAPPSEVCITQPASSPPNESIAR